MLQTWNYCKIIHVLQILKPVSIFVKKKEAESESNCV